jgi:hypothetical protein
MIIYLHSYVIHIVPNIPKQYYTIIWRTKTEHMMTVQIDTTRIMGWAVQI